MTAAKYIATLLCRAIFTMPLLFDTLSRHVCHVLVIAIPHYYSCHRRRHDIICIHYYTPPADIYYVCHYGYIRLRLMLSICFALSPLIHAYD